MSDNKLSSLGSIKEQMQAFAAKKNMTLSTLVENSNDQTVYTLPLDRTKSTFTFEKVSAFVLGDGIAKVNANSQPPVIGILTGGMELGLRQGNNSRGPNTSQAVLHRQTKCAKANPVSMAIKAAVPGCVAVEIIPARVTDKLTNEVGGKELVGRLTMQGSAPQKWVTLDEGCKSLFQIFVEDAYRKGLKHGRGNMSNMLDTDVLACMAKVIEASENIDQTLGRETQAQEEQADTASGDNEGGVDLTSNLRTGTDSL